VGRVTSLSKQVARRVSSWRVLGMVLCTLFVARGGTADDHTKQVTADRLSFRVPADWIQQTPASSMRKAQFEIPAKNDDKEAASLVVYYFGPNQGGSVEANLKRWEQQFEVPEGTSLAEVKKVEESRPAGLNVTILELAGTYVAPLSARNPNVRHNKPNFRLFAAVVETVDGPFFFKIVGPAQTMEQQRGQYMQLIVSLSFQAK